MGRPPIQVRRIRVVLRAQNVDFLGGENEQDFSKLKDKRGKRYMIIIDMIKAMKLPSLFGMEHRMGYANRKNHSG